MNQYDMYMIQITLYRGTKRSIKTAGSLGPETLLFLRELGHRLKQVAGEAKSFGYLQQHLSAAVQWGNGAGVMGTMGGITFPLISFANCLKFWRQSVPPFQNACYYTLHHFLVLIMDNFK